MPGRAATIPAVLLIALLVASFPAAAQHGHGGVTSHNDTVELGPAGGGSDEGVVVLSTVGIDVSAGYTFQFSWTVDNGTGPPVHFEIFAHSTTLHLVYYAKNASQDSGTWQVPGSDAYYVSWTNPNHAWVNVSYAFQGVPGADVTPVLVGGSALILAVVAYIVYSLRRISGESAAKTPKRPDGKTTAPAEHSPGGSTAKPPGP